MTDDRPAWMTRAIAPASAPAATLNSVVVPVVDTELCRGCQNRQDGRLIYLSKMSTELDGKLRAAKTEPEREAIRQQHLAFVRDARAAMTVIAARCRSQH